MNYHANISRTCPANWTDERVAELTRLWTEGLSCSEIAAVMGPNVSRNAVIGKAHRLNLPKRIEGVNPERRYRRAARSGVYKPKREPKPKPKPRVNKSFVILPPLASLPPPLSNAWEPVSDSPLISLLELTDAVCRWPVGGDYQNPGTGFCGCPVAPGRPYCPDHYATSIGKGSLSERKAVSAAKREARFEQWIPEAAA